MSARSAVLVAALVGGCGYNVQTLPAPVSRPPVPHLGEPTLHAGLGRADITPPPGLGTYAYGPEGLEARGFRNRLYARALVLEDADGERVAFVVADLGVISAMLHRSVASRIVEPTGIGADRLVLAATHTHAGPAHFIGVKQFDDHGSAIAGLDTAVVRFLAERIAGAVAEAVDSSRPARLAVARVPVWGFTRNRSLSAYRRNPDSLKVYLPPPDLELEADQRAVDPTWTMLRVDQLAPDGSGYLPAGALSIFAIHGNAIPSVNDLFDGDIHALVERQLEMHIDSLTGWIPTYEPRAVHLLANGTVGDVAPIHPESARCPPPQLRLGRRPGGPHAPPPAEEWRPVSPERAASCMASAAAYVDSAGRALAQRAAEIFDGLASRLSGEIVIARSFLTLPLKGELAPQALCEQPRVGTATLAGSESSPTRYYGWRFIGLFPTGFEHGGSAIGSPTGSCHAPKRLALGALQGMLVGEHGFPELAQLMVVQLGGLLLVAVPAEVTVGAGVMMQNSVRRAAEAAGLFPESTALIGLANGDLRYVTTPWEYTAQDYEGASTLYGPATAEVLSEKLGELTAAVAAGSPTVSPVQLEPITAYAGRVREILPPSDAGPEPERIQRVFVDLACDGKATVARWVDTYPGRLIPADGPILRIDRGSPAAWSPLTWDDDSHLEIRAIKAMGKRGYLWEARWNPPVRFEGSVRFVLLARSGLAELPSGPVLPCSR